MPNNFSAPSPLHAIDSALWCQAVFSRAAGADPKARTDALQTIKDFSARMQRVKDLVVIKKQSDARAALATDGITIPDDMFALAFEQYASDETRRSANTHLHQQIVAKLTQETEPIAKRIARAVIADVGADLNEAEKVERRFRARYNVGAELTTLRESLDGLVAEMRRIVERGHDLSLNPRPCHVVAAWFPEPLDLSGLITS